MQIAALAGEQIDLQRYGELTDRLRRLLESIGLERRARDVTPTLQQYIASKRALPVDSVSASSATETAAEPEKRASGAASPSEGPPS